MKKIFVKLFTVALLGSAGIASAQNRVQSSTDDGYLRQDGKIVEVRDGKLFPLNNNVGLANGITLLTDGTLIRQDGGRVALNEGQAVDRFGQLLTPRRDRDGDIILWPRRDRDDDRRDRDDDRYERDRDDRDRYEGNRSVGKGKNGKQGPPYGNAYGHYKNKDKKNKKDKDYNYSERRRGDRNYDDRYDD